MKLQNQPQHKYRFQFRQLPVCTLVQRLIKKCGGMLCIPTLGTTIRLSFRKIVKGGQKLNVENFGGGNIGLV